MVGAGGRPPAATIAWERSCLSNPGRARLSASWLLTQLLPCGARWAKKSATGHGPEADQQFSDVMANKPVEPRMTMGWLRPRKKQVRIDHTTSVPVDLYMELLQAAEARR